MYFALKDDYKLAMQALERMNTFNMILVLSWGLLFTMVWGISYQILGAKYKKNYSLLEGINVAFIGNFLQGLLQVRPVDRLGRFTCLRSRESATQMGRAFCGLTLSFIRQR